VKVIPVKKYIVKFFMSILLTLIKPTHPFSITPPRSSPLIKGEDEGGVLIL